MTNSVYTLATIKKEPSTFDEPEYMDINADEAEAGSILMSLSQHTKRTERPTTTNTMSIRNLLEDNDDRATSHQEQSKMNGQMVSNSSRSTIAHRYPEAIKEEPQTYANEMHGHHQTSTIPPPDASTPMGSTVRRQSESIDWQHQQQSPYNTYHHHHPYHQHERYQHRPSHPHHQQYQQHQQHQHQHQQQIMHPQQHQQAMKKSYTRHDPQHHIQQSTRKQPKIRRSALHIYMSYITYTDLKRMKSNAHSQQSHGPQVILKQNMQSPSMPISKKPTAPDSSSVQHQQYQQHHHHLHHQPPLTAFLKDTVESNVPTTPIPKSSLPPIEPHRPSTDWPDRHYHSSPPPPPPPHYRRHPYPNPSFPSK